MMQAKTSRMYLPSWVTFTSSLVKHGLILHCSAFTSRLCLSGFSSGGRRHIFCHRERHKSFVKGRPMHSYPFSLASVIDRRTGVSSSFGDDGVEEVGRVRAVLSRSARVTWVTRVVMLWVEPSCSGDQCRVSLLVVRSIFQLKLTVPV